MEIVYVKGKNFQSFKEVHYEIRNGEPVLIHGENLTDPGQESNGAGKSALMIIIEYCILHTTSKKINDSDLVNWDNWGDCELELAIHCPIRKETLLIERVIPLKGSGRAQLSINGDIKFAFADKMVDEIDRAVINWVGISKDDLQNFYILSKFKYTSFFAASNTALNQLIGRFSNAEIIAGVDKDILSKVDQLTSERLTLAGKKERIYGMIDVHEKILEAEKTIDKNALMQARLDAIDDEVIAEGDKIAEYTAKIAQLTEEQQDCVVEAQAVAANIQSINTQLKELEDKFAPFVERYRNIDAKINESRINQQAEEESLRQYNSQKHEALLVLQEIERNLKGAITCPKCHFEFIAGKEDVDVAKEKEAQVLSNALIEQLDGVIAATTIKAEAFIPAIKGLRQSRIQVEAEEKELQSLKRSITNALLNVEREKGQWQNKADGLAQAIKQNQNFIVEAQNRAQALLTSKSSITIESFDNAAKIKSIQDSIAECQLEILGIEGQDEDVANQIIEIKQWAATFKEFYQYLSVKTLKVLQGYANKFLEDLHTDLRVQLEGYKVKADGSLADKITAYILRNGKVKGIGNFSGGERVKLEAAMILTIQHAINSTHPYGGLNFLSIDEIFESTDGLGLNMLTSALIPLKKTIILTSHIPGNNYECAVLRIVKENGISTIN